MNGGLPKGTLTGIRVVDLSRVLAGPVCTQILGDLGADVIKIEKPGAGDDTRAWGPPFLKDADGKDTSESAYYLSANRNKRSVAIDIASAEGQEIVHKLLARSDILIENFKVGALEKYGLSFEAVQARHPHIIYASITGFGQTGPRAPEAGYDLLAQAMAGLMAITGEPGGEPMKAGVALSDVITGLYAATGILAALHKRKETGLGQRVDLALFDCTLASLTNVAQYYLTSGKVAERQGNAHATIVPYQAFEAADGWLVVAVGNDGQFAKFAALLGAAEWIADSRFTSNAARVAHRDNLVPIIAAQLRKRDVAQWVGMLTDAGIPAGPVNRVDQVFAEAQVQAREMKIEMTHPLSAAKIDLIGSPLKLSRDPVTYRHSPPPCGAQTDAVLSEVGIDIATLQDLRARGVIG